MPSGWYDRAAIIAGRSLTRSKAPGRIYPIGAGPHYAVGGDGAELIAEDGRRYLDMLCALGAISLGYGWTPHRESGGVYSLPHVDEIVAAEAVLRDVAPWATSVRFVKTGSEALQAAMLIARRTTGRHRILVARGAFHGWHAWCSEEGPLNRTVRHYEYGTAPAVWPMDDVAAIFVEPARWQPTTTAWLLAVKARARQCGALFVLDEMVFGGRWALGGASAYYDGVIPDLACYGKALGNGAPIAFLAGGDALREHGEQISGTYSGEAAALGALLSVLSAYRTCGVIDWMWARGRQLQEGLRSLCASSSIGVVVEGAPVHQRLRFPTDDLAAQFSAEMIRRGVLWHPQCVNVCRAHTEAHISQALAAASESLAALADEPPGRDITPLVSHPPDETCARCGSKTS